LDNNTKSLLQPWALALTLGSLSVFGLAAAVVRGEYLFPVIAIAFVTLLLLLMWRSKRQAVRFFQDGTPDRAVAHYYRSMSRVQNGPALAAYMCGLTFSFYGEYDKAREELARVSWTNIPPMYDGFRTYVLSIVALLEEKDFRKALDLAIEARELCRASALLPGAATSKRALDAHVLACELLAMPANKDTVLALEKALRTLSGVAPVMPAWSLRQYYNRIGDKQSATAHMAILKRLVPNCRPLMSDS
jgi:hypothetical protein